MSDIAQKTFFGASIRGFTSNIGWSDQPSSIEIDLVEDPRNGDAFVPTPIGGPAYFAYYGFGFGGIVQKYERVGSTSGDPLYKVILTDPRELLYGVQIIISDYTGSTFNVPNLYNVFGYIESTQGFGAAQTNDSGIPWKVCRNALLELINITPINFRGQPYLLDLSALPELPDEYRVGGGVPSISVMDFIAQICQDGARDFFFTQNLTGLGHVITLRTIDRSVQPAFGAINNFIASVQGAVSHGIGLELRNDTTSKFLVGGKVATQFFQFWDEGVDENELDFADNPIAPFFGLNPQGNVILPTFLEAEDDEPAIKLQAKGLNVEGIKTLHNSDNGAFYPTTEDELRAALGGRSSWETYLWFNNGNEHSVHYQKAEKLGLIGDVRRDIHRVIADLPLEKFKKFDPRSLAPFLGADTKRAAEGLTGDLVEESLGRLFDFISGYAQEFYGRKFMVRVPNVSAKLDPLTGIITTSHEVTEGGFIEESEFPNAIGAGLLPVFPDFVRLEDGRFMCYVKYNDAEEVDLSFLNIGDYYLSSYIDNTGTPKNAVFIKAEVDSKFVYLQRSTVTSPRAVVTLPGPVFLLDGEAGEVTDFIGVLRPIFIDKALSLGLTNAEAIDIVRKIFGRIGADQIMFPQTGYTWEPDIAAIPLQSNTETYGPWYATGALGGTEFDQDETLVPWNYGGFELMNTAALAAVNEALSFQQVSEAGTVEVPDVPAISIGSILINGGPLVTNVNVNVGAQGVTTTYRMDVWTPRFGKVYKQAIDRAMKLTRRIQNRRREVRSSLLNPLSPHSRFQKSKVDTIISNTKRMKGESTIGYIIGEVHDSGNFPSNRISIALSPSYHTGNQTGSNIENKAAMSLDGLFVPFSTSPSYSGLLPKYERVPINRMPNNTSLTIFGNPELRNIHDGGGTVLSNFSFHNIQYILRGSGNIDDTIDHFWDEEGNIYGDFITTELAPKIGNVFNTERAIALRGPLVIAGWGLDTCGLPVPNASGSDNGVSDSYPIFHKVQPRRWKVGPVDLRWHHKKKIWTSVTEEGRTNSLVGPADLSNHSWSAFNAPGFAVSSGLTTYHPRLDGDDKLRFKFSTSTISPVLQDVYNPFPYRINSSIIRNVHGYDIIDRPLHPLMGIFTSDAIDSNDQLIWGGNANNAIHWGDFIEVDPTDSTAIKFTCPVQAGSRYFKVTWNIKATVNYNHGTDFKPVVSTVTLENRSGVNILRAPGANNFGASASDDVDSIFTLPPMSGAGNASFTHQHSMIVQAGQNGKIGIDIGYSLPSVTTDTLSEISAILRVEPLVLV